MPPSPPRLPPPVRPEVSADTGWTVPSRNTRAVSARSSPIFRYGVPPEASTLREKGDTETWIARPSSCQEPVKVWEMASGWKVRMAGWPVTAVSTPFTRRTGGSYTYIYCWAVKSKSPDFAVI